MPHPTLGIIDNLKGGIFTKQLCHIPSDWRQRFTPLAGGFAHDLPINEQIDGRLVYRIATTDEALDILALDLELRRRQLAGRGIATVEGVRKSLALKS